MITAPSMTFARLQTGASTIIFAIEQWLDEERDQIGLWLPVALGLGIALWFTLLDQNAWIAVIIAGCSAAVIGLAIGHKRRFGTLLSVGGLCIAIGCALAWGRAEYVTAPRLVRPVVASFEAKVTRIENQRAKAQSRVWMAPSPASKLPPLIRVTVKDKDMVSGLAAGDDIRLRARLVPPPDAPSPTAMIFREPPGFSGLARAVVRLTRYCGFRRHKKETGCAPGFRRTSELILREVQGASPLPLLQEIGAV